jgi:hypothetical protein
VRYPTQQYLIRKFLQLGSDQCFNLESKTYLTRVAMARIPHHFQEVELTKILEDRVKVGDLCVSPHRSDGKKGVA